MQHTICTTYAHRTHTTFTHTEHKNTHICSTSTIQIKNTEYIAQNTISHTILHNIDIKIHINLNTEHRYTDTEYRTQTQDNAQPQHTCTHSYSYIVLIFMMNTYISKNSIIQLYTNFIHFGHLIDEVSKITNIEKNLYINVIT